MHYERRLLTFSHIPKTAGTTLIQILKRHFGFRHVAVEYRHPPPLYTRRDLALDLKLHPAARSLAGHTLKGFVHFGEYEDRLLWYTFLRDPIDRFISHYQHQLNSGISKFNLPFTEWMRTYERQNWMVRMIAGNEDVSAAKQILDTKFRFVGLTEKFDESLLLLRHRLDLGGLNVDYPNPYNTSKKGGVRKAIKESIESYYDDIMERNRLDVELYEYVNREIWPEQRSDYGEDALQRDVNTVFTRASNDLADKARMLSFAAYRNIIYKPCLWVDRRLTAPN